MTRAAFPLRFRYTISMKSMLRIGVASAVALHFHLCLLSSPGAFAQEGALDPAPPKGVTTDEIIRHFAGQRKRIPGGARPVHLPAGRAGDNAR